MILFEKKLGAYYLVEMKQDNIGNITITLFKKWSKGQGYEAVDEMTFTCEEREKALVRYEMISLKTIKKYFK